MNYIILRKEKFKQKSIYVRHGKFEYCTDKKYDLILWLLTKNQKDTFLHGGEVFIDKGIVENYCVINDILSKIEDESSDILSEDELRKRR
jgi:hypothetical protein